METGEMITHLRSVLAALDTIPVWERQHCLTKIQCGNSLEAVIRALEAMGTGEEAAGEQ